MLFRVRRSAQRRRGERFWRPSFEQLENRLVLNAPTTGWDLAFVDEFNGSHIDSSKWTTHLAWSGDDGSSRHHNDAYLSYIMDDDVIESNGTLKLQTQRRHVCSAQRCYEYSEGMIQTAGKFAAAYGYFEIRAKLPVEAGRGLWPAFWLLRPTDGWPPEMDVGEWWTSNNRSHQGLAYRNSGGGVSWDDQNTYNPLPRGWHTYGMEWSPGRQVYSIDGRTTKVVNGNYVPNVPMYLILNSGVEAANPPNRGTVFPNSFEVDYVRVYQQTGAGATVRNADFEQDPPGASWNTYGGAQVVSANQRTGNQVMRIQGQGGAEQVVAGLTPNTTYTFGGWAETTRGGTPALIGVKNYGGAQRSVTITNTSYTQGAVTFTTGATDTQATVFVYKPTSAADGYFDDLYLLKAPTLSPIPSATTNVDTPTDPIPFNVGGAGGADGAWSLSATSDNPDLIPNGNISFAGRGVSRTLTATPAPGQSGTAVITVRVTDPYGGTSTTSFVLSVTPSLWSSQDIGGVGIAGGYDLGDGTVTVRGSGPDIWGSADGFHFLDQPWSGDGDLIARVASLDDTDPWAKAGVMVRESLDANSTQATMLVSAEQGLALQWRDQTGGASSSIDGFPGIAPYWVWLNRVGDTFTGYASEDGSNWFLIGAATVPMAQDVYVGLAVTSHNNRALATAVFDNVSMPSDCCGPSRGRGRAPGNRTPEINFRGAVGELRPEDLALAVQAPPLGRRDGAIWFTVSLASEVRSAAIFDGRERTPVRRDDPFHAAPSAGAGMAVEEKPARWSKLLAPVADDRWFLEGSLLEQPGDWLGR